MHFHLQALRAQTGAVVLHLVVVAAVLVGLRRPKVVQLPELGVQDLLQLQGVPH